MDTSEIIHSHIINKLERKISLMETKFVQEISKLEKRIEELEEWIKIEKADRIKAMEILKGK